MTYYIVPEANSESYLLVKQMFLTDYKKQEMIFFMNNKILKIHWLLWISTGCL